jgi:uncharacterized protein (TIGR03435 family)
MPRFTASRFGARQSQSPVSITLSAYLLVTVATILLGLVQPPRLRAQTTSHAAPALRFDVASLKIAADQNHFETIPERSPGRFTWTTQGFQLVEYAYRLQRWQISGDTGRLASIYQIVATTTLGATEDNERQMVQSLLTNRFKMVAHLSTKNADGYVLTQAKSGSQMLEAKEGEVPRLSDKLRAACGDPPRVEEWVAATVPEHDVTAITGCRATMTQLAEKLEQVLSTTMLDQTALSGKHYFAFEYAADADADASAPDLPGAIGVLGLKLSKYKGPAEVLVIDHIDQIPTPN